MEIPRDRAPADRPYVYVNFISTVDGRSAIDGRSSALGDEEDTQTLLELRTQADAVLIGSGTLRAEGYDRLVRSEERRARRVAAGLAEDPLAVVVSRSFDIPWEAGMFQAPEQPVVIYSGVAGDVPEVAAPVEVVVLPDPTLAAALADLRARGVLALLCEGGPKLHRALQAARLVDELFLTIWPALTGDDEELNILGGGRLPHGVDLTLLSVRRHGSELFLRYAVAGGRQR